MISLSAIMVPALALLVFLLASRRVRRQLDQVRRELDPDLINALKTHERDPVEGRRLLDAYRAKYSARHQAERADLWARAQMDLRAAKELRVRLHEDLAANAAARKDLQDLAAKAQKTAAEAKFFEELEEEDRKTNQELAQLEQIMAHFGHR